MKNILYKLFEHQYLGREEAKNVLQNIALGKYNDAQVASLITVFLMRNISVEEMLGFKEALLDMRVEVDLADYRPVDIVGTEATERTHSTSQLRHVSHWPEQVSMW
jgi:anthranilate phosphoribosyltransferase (EC 2.4.2.18)